MKTNVYSSYKIFAKASCHPYSYLLQAGEMTQALASAAMSILPLLKTEPLDPDASKTSASAFDDAWNVMRRSSSTLAADDKAVVTREVLAKRNPASARTGERERSTAPREL
jgi:hypothetical protein